VHVFNVTGRPVAWKSGAVLGNLERLHAYSAQSPTPPRQQAPADLENQIVDEMMNKVDPSVSDEYKVKLRQMLLRNSAAFSKNELDLRFTDLLRTALTQATHDLSVISALLTSTSTTCRGSTSLSHVNRPGLQISC